MRQLTKNNGFTLYEIIVALAVSAILFSLISTIAISIHRNYKNAKELDEMNNEVYLVSKLIRNTINSYNEVGKSINYTEPSIEVDEENVFRVKDENGLIIEYKSANSQALEYNCKYITDIKIEIIGDNLLKFKITDKKGRDKIIFINMVNSIK